MIDYSVPIGALAALLFCVFAARVVLRQPAYRRPRGWRIAFGAWYQEGHGNLTWRRVYMPLPIVRRVHPHPERRNP